MANSNDIFDKSAQLVEMVSRETIYCMFHVKLYV